LISIRIRLLDTENECIKHELFEDGQEHLLVQALLESCPEVSATVGAVAKVLVDGDAGDDEDDSEGNGQ
jgi:hypothetical protein